MISSSRRNLLAYYFLGGALSNGERNKINSQLLPKKLLQKTQFQKYGG